MGPRNGRDIGVDFAYNCIVPFELAGDGQRVMVDFGRVPLGREAEIKIVSEGVNNTDGLASISSSYVPVLLDYPEKACRALAFIIPSNAPSNYSLLRL